MDWGLPHNDASARKAAGRGRGRRAAGLQARATKCKEVLWQVD